MYSLTKQASHELLPLYHKYGTFQRVALFTIVLTIVYLVLLAFYRIFFHPLASFPGPKLAALSKWYEFYYDVWKDGGGRYTFRLKQLHAQYGPIIRVNPDELHVDDPDYYETLYAGRGERRNKYPPAAEMAGTPLGIFGTVDAEIHRRRRGAINQLFSKRIVNAKMSIINQKVDKLCQNLEEDIDNGGIIELRAHFLAFATDVVCEYGLGASPHPELLPNRTAQSAWQKTIYALEDLTPLVKQFYQALPIAFLVPSWVSRPFSPELSRLKALHEGMRDIAATFLKKVTCEQSEEASKAPRSTIPNTIFEEIWRSTLPEAEKSVDRLAQEGLVLIAAGGETVSRVLCVATFHVLATPNCVSKLQAELDTAWAVKGGMLGLSELEVLPYLSAVIKESLRLAAVILSRLPLVCPDKVLTYGQWVVPPGTPVSMTLAHILSDPRCFENPESFDPERWLRADEHRGRAEKYFFPFSKGSRMCLGINLAYAELYVIIANLFRRYNMQLFDTSRGRDIEHTHDCFVGKPNKTSPGVRVVMEKRNTRK